MAAIAGMPGAGRSVRAVPLTWLAAGLLGLFALDSVLLLRFLGLDARVVGAVAALSGAVFAWLTLKTFRTDARVSLPTLAAAFGVAFGVLLLGGEGRLFYATPDWQIRDAVLVDLAGHAWPFAYDINGTGYLLRAPLGMYLLPALAGKGGLLDAALLVSNALHLGLVLALGSALFERAAARWIALAVFLAFSGLDALGVFTHAAAGMHEAWDHIEAWNEGMQFSSTLTVAFWAPNHGIAGWACAVAFALWRRGIAPIGLFGALLPLAVFWSPLAVMGAVPFAIYAGIVALWRRGFGWGDVALTALAVAIAIPVLWYERLDPGAVAMHLKLLRPMAWTGVAYEMLPLVGLAFSSPWFDRKDRAILGMIAACVVLMPAWRIGESADFQMRASIMPLALLALAWARALLRGLEIRPRPGRALAVMGAILAVGAVTPGLELKRALVAPPSPPPLCSLAGAWRAQSGLIVPFGTYLARQSMLPGRLRGVPVAIRHSDDPQVCWARPWVVPETAD